MTDLILVLGDQLSPNLSGLQAAPHAHVVMAELYAEATYGSHHQQNRVLVFSAMRHVAQSVRDQGRDVTYFAYGETPELKSFTDVLAHKLASGTYERVFVTEPGEYRLTRQFADWSTQFDLAVHVLPDTRFLASHDEFETWVSGKKQLRMEFLYRKSGV